MRKKSLITILILVNIAVIGAVLVWYCNRTYPMVGHDYRLFVPYMLDSYLHQRINGLTIQWYTPSFGGGRPVFPIPEDLQFSLPQFLLWVVNPWWAVLGSMLVYVVIGFIATYTFLKRFLGLHPFAGILGAVFFTANGFYFNHMAVGHITFQAFTLFPVILIILVHPKLPAWLAGLLLSFVAAILLYTGIHNVIFFALTALVVLPLLYLLKPALLNGKRILAMSIWGAILTILLCGSKVWANYSFMRFYPRLVSDSYKTNLLTGMVSMLTQLLGTMTMTPIYRLLGLNTYNFALNLVKDTGTPYQFWELDASLSPALLILLAGGTIAFFLRKPRIKVPTDKKRLIAGLCLLLGIWMVIEFTLAKGLIYPLLHRLPGLESVRGNIRNICAFIFPLAVVGAVIFNNATANSKSNARLWSAFLVLNGIALGSLWFFHYVSPKSLQLLTDMRPMLTTYHEIRYEGETFPIKNVVPRAAPWTVFDDNAVSMMDPYSTFFKDIYRFLVPILHAGPVSDISDGYYNIINPTAYVFPEENHSRVNERIPVSEKAQFLDFINRRQSDWKLPLMQQVLDWIALVTLIAEFCAVLAWPARKWIRLPKRSSQA